MTRAAMFDAIRPFAKDQKFSQANVLLIDRLADELGVPTDTPAPSSVVTTLTDQDFVDAANLLGAKYAQVRAVWEVEAGGQGFIGTRPKILFEAHVFDKETGGRFRASHPNLSSQKWNRSLYAGGEKEWDRLEAAMKLDATAALKSASWGGPQIMGFNHKLAGFDTVQAFVEAMKSGARSHLMAFVKFIQNSRMADRLKQIDVSAVSAAPFARAYNGPGFAVHAYDAKLAAAYKKWATR